MFDNQFECVRFQHARSRVRELDESKNKYMQIAARHQRQHGAIMPSATTASGAPASAITMASTGTPVSATTTAKPTPSPSQATPPNLAPLTTTAAETNPTQSTITTSTPPTTSS